MFTIGTRVIDRDGRRGTIVKLSVGNGGHWYDVRFPAGDAIRYDSDLRADPYHFQSNKEDV